MILVHDALCPEIQEIKDQLQTIKSYSNEIINRGNNMEIHTGRFCVLSGAML